MYRWHRVHQNTSSPRVERRTGCFTRTTLQRRSAGKCVWVRVIHAHILSLFKACTIKKEEAEVYRAPTATSYFASYRPQMADSCKSIQTLTVQKDNSVIICGPDLEPNNTDLVLSSINPLVKTIKCHFFFFFFWVSRHTDYKRQNSRASIWYKVVQITTSECFHTSTFNFGMKNRLRNPPDRLITLTSFAIFATKLNFSGLA